MHGNCSKKRSKIERNNLKLIELHLQSLCRVKFLMLTDYANLTLKLKYLAYWT